MNLVLDFGNTLQKMSVIAANNEIDFVSKNKIDNKDIISMTSKYDIQNAILSTVVPLDKKILLFLNANFNFILFNYQTDIPIINKYQSAKTLGSDRLAAVIGANHLFPRTNILVIQFGSCITFDFINQNAEYLGGSISPGMTMRFNALNSFSANLPKINPQQINSFIGNNTKKSILTGVMHGIIDECNGKISRYKKKYSDLKIVLTGGDVNIFKNSIKNEIFAFPNLVMFGLNLILNYNVEK